MADHDSTHEFHDELLSAYLDGELLPSERARVEERLAVDPVARQMLGELRSVSQALQDLPHESLGEDLGPAILQRTGRVAPAASAPLIEPTASPALAVGPARFTVGRTRRGWFWAAMAVAAALVIMFVERDKDKNPQLPDVAAVSQDHTESSKSDVTRHDTRSLDVDKRSSSEVPKLSALAESTRGGAGTPGDNSTPAAVQSAPGSTAESLTDDVTRRRVALIEGEAAGSRSDGMLAGAVLDGRESAQRGERGDRSLDEQTELKIAGGRINRYSATQPDTPMKAADDLGVLTTADADRKADEASKLGEMTRGAVTNAPATANFATSAYAALNAEGVLVVYVDVKRDALQNRTIDRQLSSHGIVLDTNAAATAVALPPGNFSSDSFLAYKNAAGQSHEFALKLSLLQPSETDAILVDAPAAQVDSLLTSLDADSDNVVSMSIDDDKALADNAAKASQLALVDWSKFKRVNLPENLRQLNRQDQKSLQIASNLDSSAMGADSTALEGRRRAGRGGGGAGGGRGRGAGVASGRGGRRGRAPTPGERAAGQAATEDASGESAAGQIAPATPTPNSTEPANVANKETAKDNVAAAAGAEATNEKSPPAQQQQSTFGGSATQRGFGSTMPMGGGGFGASNAGSNPSGTGQQGQVTAQGSSGFGAGGYGGGGGRAGGQFGSASGPAAPGSAASLSTGANDEYRFRQSSGRAVRVTIAPQPAMPARTPAQSQTENSYRLYVERDAQQLTMDQNAQKLGSDAPPATAPPVGVQGGGRGAAFGDAAAAGAGQGSPVSSNERDLKTSTAPPAEDRFPRRMPEEAAKNEAAKGGEMTTSTTTPPTAGGAVGLRQQFTQSPAISAATQPPAANSMQVLFLFRVQPASTTTPATEAAGKAATSPAGSDAAK